MKIDKSITIDAPVEQVFAYLVDPTNEPEYETGLDEVKDVQRLPNGGYRYTEVYKFLGLRSEITNEDVEFVPNERVVTKFESSLMDGTSTVRFERLAGGKTRVNMVGESTPPGGPLAKFGEPFLTKYMDHMIEMTMEAVKARLAAKTPSGTPG